MSYTFSNRVKISLAIIFSSLIFSCSSDYIYVKVKKSELIPDSYELNRDSLIVGGIKICKMAQRYYYKPVERGGGNLSFVGFTVPPHLVNSEYGEYELSSVKPKMIILTGSGIIKGADQINPLKVKFFIQSAAISTTIVN